MTLGWYIHHHGSGHLHRFLAVAPHLEEVTVLSSLARPAAAPSERWIELPLDVPVSGNARAGADAGGRLHWAPVGVAGYRERMAAIAAWIAAARPEAVVVDVSVEVAVLARLMGAEVVWVAQRGERTDPPHRLVFDLARSIIAPWTAEVDRPDHRGAPPAQRTTHVGALSRFDDRPAPPPPASRTVAVLMGSGGHAVTPDHVYGAARATPDWNWEVAGVDGLHPARNVTALDARDDVWAMLGRAAVVVASASGNAIAEVAAARRPLICLPQPRPFAEQHEQARELARAGLAVVAPQWPAPECWPSLLRKASARDPQTWSRLHDGGGARRFAAAVRAACG